MDRAGGRFQRAINNNTSNRRLYRALKLENKKVYKLRLSKRYMWKQEPLWIRYLLLLGEFKKIKEHTSASGIYSLTT